ncbi:hypothetical protein BSKO_07439 [Bryopsis sp. KO-2023]|nr:hypothetical protein BSKO_07439 [Bryopsis sp. KO-2023]
MEGSWLDPCVAPDFVAALRKQFRNDACGSFPEVDVDNAEADLDILQRSVCQEIRMAPSVGVGSIQIRFDDPEFLQHLPRFTEPQIPSTTHFHHQQQNSANKHGFGSGCAREPSFAVGNTTVLSLDPTVNNIRRRTPQTAFSTAIREAPAPIDERDFQLGEATSNRKHVPTFAFGTPSPYKQDASSVASFDDLPSGACSPTSVLPNYGTVHRKAPAIEFTRAKRWTKAEQDTQNDCTEISPNYELTLPRQTAACFPKAVAKSEVPLSTTGAALPHPDDQEKLIKPRVAVPAIGGTTARGEPIKALEHHGTELNPDYKLIEKRPASWSIRGAPSPKKPTRGARARAIGPGTYKPDDSNVSRTKRISGVKFSTASSGRTNGKIRAQSTNPHEDLRDVGPVLDKLKRRTPGVKMTPPLKRELLSKASDAVFIAGSS